MSEPKIERRPLPNKNHPAVSDALKHLLAAPNICSKRWVFQQYDHMVRTNTAVLPGADAAVVRIKETRRAVSMCLDGNGRYVAVNPREGAKLVIAESARNNACVGARPIAVTNCLNFASPERPEVMWSFSEVIDGMTEACNTLGTPVISGNVSFYNETEGRGILPTPTIGMVGLLEDVRKLVTQGFKDEGDLIILLGLNNGDLAVSEYSQSVLGNTIDDLIACGEIPRLDLDLEKKVQDVCIRSAEEGLIKSAHDCSDGGLAVAIAESCFHSLNRESIGAELVLEASGLTDAEVLFGESPSRIVVTVSANDLERLKSLADDCPLAVIGTVKGKRLSISREGRILIDERIESLESIWADSLKSSIQN